MAATLDRITLATSPESVLKMIAIAREKKVGWEETLKLIDRAIQTTQDYIVNLYFERAHIFQLVYMTERDKLTKGDSKKKKEALGQMEKYTKLTSDYIQQNNLQRWLHRVYRFLGKISEYKKDYVKAIEFYRQSLKYWRLDPEVVARRLPRNFEVEGFLASALIMSGDVRRGFRLAKEVYKKYELTRAGRELKNKDYTTWAIWRSGVMIFSTRGLIEGKITSVSKEEILEWLDEAWKLLHPPKIVVTWADFQFRKDEISALRKLLV